MVLAGTPCICIIPGIVSYSFNVFFLLATLQNNLDLHKNDVNKV